MSEWISVDDRLPEENQIVLAHYTGVYAADVVEFWSDEVNNHFGGQPATHWMPLEPPKTEPTPELFEGTNKALDGLSIRGES